MAFHYWKHYSVFAYEFSIFNGTSLSLISEVKSWSHVKTVSRVSVKNNKMGAFNCHRKTFLLCCKVAVMSKHPPIYLLLRYYHNIIKKIVKVWLFIIREAVISLLAERTFYIYIFTSLRTTKRLARYFQGHRRTILPRKILKIRLGNFGRLRSVNPNFVLSNYTVIIDN